MVKFERETEDNCTIDTGKKNLVIPLFACRQFLAIFSFSQKLLELSFCTIFLLTRVGFDRLFQHNFWHNLL